MRFLVSSNRTCFECVHPFVQSKQCWCDDGTADYEQNGPDVCDYACAGSSDGEFCGGFDAMSIRRHEVENSFSYIGCYYDSTGYITYPVEPIDGTTPQASEKATLVRNLNLLSF